MEPDRARTTRKNRIAAISREFRSLSALAQALRSRALRYFETLNRAERSGVLRRYLNRRRRIVRILEARQALRLLPVVETPTGSNRRWRRRA